MPERFFTEPKTLRCLRAGPLGPQLPRFTSHVVDAGYAAATIKYRLRIASALSIWMETERLELESLDESVVGSFLQARARCRRPRAEDGRTLQLLLAFLRAADVLAPPAQAAVEDGVARVLARYRCYLLDERGLAKATTINYVSLVRRFLERRYGAAKVALPDLCANDVTQFLLEYVGQSSRGRSKLMATALRSFLRFLHFEGETAEDLGSAVPVVPNWRLQTIPKHISEEKVERILDGCDRHTAVGRRDYAILLLLARLGLRAGELVALTLDDCDWDAGVIIIRGSKRTGQHQLPLPQDVGEALAEYLSRDRPRCSTRRVFIRARAPHRGFASSVSICTIVREAIVRAGVEAPSHGAHLLRHSLATRMIRQGASLAEVGEILRHRHPDTTAIYAKVDLASLRTVVIPWPETAR